MNNNKTESYQKLKALYQHKFFTQDSNQQLINSPNPIKFKKALQGMHTHHLQLSSPSVSHRNKITSSKHYAQNQITIQYQQIHTELHTLPTTWKHNVPQTSRAKPRNHKIFINLKTLGFPFTTRQTPSPLSKAHPKKHSLMEMIEELKRLKQTEHSNIERTAEKKEKVYKQYKCRHNTESLRCSQKERQKEARIKMSASYNTSKPTRARKDERTNFMPNDSKTSEIDPWVVSENDFEGKKYY